MAHDAKLLALRYDSAHFVLLSRGRARTEPGIASLTLPLALEYPQVGKLMEASRKRLERTITVDMGYTCVQRAEADAGPCAYRRHSSPEPGGAYSDCPAVHMG